MALTPTFRRVIWAVDPFAEDVELQRQSFQTLATLIGPRENVIEPASVVHWENRYIIGKKETTLEEFKAQVAEKVNEIAKRFGARGLLPPKVLVQESYSLTLAVQCLVEYAAKESVELIALGTQSREGTTRFLLGSFAETLILNSPIPTLLVSPRTAPLHAVKRVLFPTDFSDEAKRGFRSVLELAGESRAKIIMFHANVARTNAECEALAAPLLNVARERGIEIEFVLQNDKRPAADAILDRLRDKPDTLVAVISKQHPSGRILVGGITRQVIRQAPVPVWVLHPKVK